MLLSVNVFVSLDGVMQGPGAPDEDRSGGFDRGGWLVPHASAHTNEVVEGWFREADAFLFGRTSYGLLGGYWPKVTAPGNLIAAKLNTLPKYVVSRTLTDGEADWSPTTVLRTGIVDDVRRLKGLPARSSRSTAVGNSCRSCTRPGSSTSTGCSSTPSWSAPENACFPRGRRLRHSPLRGAGACCPAASSR